MRHRTANLWKAALLMVAALFISSCAEELSDPQQAMPEGTEQLLSLSFRTVNPGVRAIGEGQEASSSKDADSSGIDEGTSPDYEVKDFWIIQFNEKGFRIGSPHYYEMEDYADVVPVVLPTDKNVSYKCVIIANTHTPNLDLETVTDINKLKALHRKIKDNTWDWLLAPGGKDLIMNGTVEIKHDTETLDCDLYRNVAKLTFTLTNKEGSGIKINSVQLRNVADHLFYADRLYEESAAPSPTTSESGFIDMPADDFEGGFLPGEESKTLTYYLPRNRRGTTHSTRPEDKNIDVPAFATFVEVMAEDEKTEAPLRYRFYLGKNMRDDFNVEPNHHYTLPVIISTKGDAEADSRVEVFDKVEFGESNSYIVNPLGGPAQRLHKVPVSRINSFWRNEGEKVEPIAPETEWVAEVIWQDADRRLINFCDENGKVMEGNTQYAGKGDSFFCFEPVAGAEGNLLVGVRLKDSPDTGDREYLWSWHLWITSYNPDGYEGSWVDGKYTYPVEGGVIHRYAGGSWEKAEYNDKFIMDRNLGAAGASCDDYNASIGFYYQFGRKDPFPHSTAKLYDIEGNPNKNFTHSGDDCIMIEKGSVQLTTAVKRPYVFNVASTTDWVLDNPYSLNRWNNPEWNSGNKSLFDPCPEGWQVPKTNNIWTIFFSADNNYKPNAVGFKESGSAAFNRGWNFYINGYDEGDTAWYPSSGQRSIDSGSIDFAASGTYWTSSASSNTHAAVLRFVSSSMDPDWTARERSYGVSVRCVRE